jgi:two-component system LytT family sensor kinase
MGELLNLVGLSTGVVLYAMLLAMVVRGSRTPGVPSRFDSLLLATSVLGLVWNLCALPAYELPKVGIRGPFPTLVALGFSALGLLPAVVVHSVLRGERKAIEGLARRSVVTAAYAVSLLAGVLHVQAAVTGAPVPSGLAMRLLTYTFVALVVPLAALTRRQPGSRRAVWAAALAAFAVSALHLSQLHQGEASWPVELLGHHASVPLAFAILYQDYPFALADLFLKRALTLVMLVTIAFVVIATFGVQSLAFDQFLRVDPRQVGALVTMWVAATLAYPALRQAISWFVDSVILRRPDYRSLRATATRRVQAYDDIPDLLTDLCALLRPAMSARAVAWHEWSSPLGEFVGSSVVAVGDPALRVVKALALRADGDMGEVPRPAATVLIPVTEAPRYALIVAELTGGRRLLSDDLSALESIAIVVARRIDAIRITRERYQRELREQEIAKLVTEAELRALRAQVNPHFLFNALTTLGYLIQTAPDRALETLLRLTSLLRGVLRSEGEFASLGRELDIVEAYLEIEQARFEERLRIRIDVPKALRTIRVPALLLQPIVENAVKHGVSPQQQGGDVTILGTLERGADGSLDLSLTVADTGSGATAAELRRGRALGVGLSNVERRLQGQYGTAASLSIQSVPGTGTTVTIRLPAESSRTADQQVGSVG